MEPRADDGRRAAVPVGRDLRKTINMPSDATVADVERIHFALVAARPQGDRDLSRRQRKLSPQPLSAGDQQEGCKKDETVAAFALAEGSSRAGWCADLQKLLNVSLEQAQRMAEACLVPKSNVVQAPAPQPLPNAAHATIPAALQSATASHRKRRLAAIKLFLRTGEYEDGHARRDLHRHAQGGRGASAR